MGANFGIQRDPKAELEAMKLVDFEVVGRVVSFVGENAWFVGDPCKVSPRISTPFFPFEFWPIPRSNLKGFLREPRQELEINILGRPKFKLCLAD